ncbi:aldehyde dehydrogenase family protein [Granulosicoccus antarcticus]|uniref:Phenylacetaldehyde dehydrogenase n=1 Tax=Granulosicoccus antarcticus IMCC3135 TaxID=1192854 RepID=A0A2Z2NSG3_9GAMM|nr:aldehyde dehydrogenase family protein [Granulosicoccus antarcticus]ASJ73445.1 Phenylacetaldehyde dehydrogenase [Granulosicoccus antarcticus IMCC3135]
MIHEYHMTIGGRDASAKAFLDVINPATEDVIGRAPDAGNAELDAAVEAAQRAFPSWAATPWADRQAALVHAAEVINENKEELAQLLTLEHGKPLAEARREMDTSRRWCTSLATLELPVEVVSDENGRRVEVRHEPIGVVAGISPWNVPVSSAIWKILPAVLTGNTIVVKPAPTAPLTVLKIGELLRDVFPAGVINVITGGDALGPLITAHPGFGKISFTGSTATGRAVMASASAGVKRLTLELGGNDPALVFADIDIPDTAAKLFRSAFFNNGQVCVATKRCYVHEDIYDAFLAEMTRLVAGSLVATGTTDGVALGPIHNKAQFESLTGMLDTAKAEGLVLIQPSEIPSGKGYFLAPTLVDNPPEDSQIMQEEQFGPILPLVKFKDTDDVIERANASQYGLAATVWTKNRDLALDVAARLDTGNVWVNEPLAFSPFAVFGGRKQSGLGVEHGLRGLEEFTNSKAVTLNFES